MTKKIALAVALVAVAIVSVSVYNKHFKGIFGAVAKNYIENPKCDFNPQVNGGGQNTDFNFIAHGGGAIVLNEQRSEIFTYTNSKEAL